MADINIFNLALVELQIFMLVVIRIAALFLTAPLFGSRNVPDIIKIAFSFIVAFLIFPSAGKITGTMPPDILSFALLALQQVIVGVVIGFAAYMLFAAIQLSGQIIDLQMGFGIVNVIDPMSNSQVSILGQFKFVLGMLIFMSINGHHMLIQAISDSFRLAPIGAAGMTQTAALKLSDMFYNMFVIAFKIAGPATLALFLTNLTLGFIARTIPQMNVFIVGLPLNILVGITAVLFSLPVIVNLFNSLLVSMWDDIYYIIRAMRVA